MHSVPLAGTGLALTRIVVGAARAPVPVARGVDLLAQAWEGGVRAVDVTDLSAGHETAAERFLEDRQPEQAVVLARLGTTVGPERGADLSPGRIASSLASGARRLGRIDLGWLPGTDSQTPPAATLTALAEAIESGRLKGWGTSGVDVWQLEGWLVAADRAGLPRPVAVRNRLNLLARGDERDLHGLATGERLGVLATQPFAGGRLTDRHVEAEEHAAAAVAAGGERTVDADPAFGGLLRLRDLARERSVSTAALALAWLSGHPAVTSVIVAPRALAEWDVVPEAEGVALGDEERERLEAVAFPTTPTT